ncbi:outer membrane beta-barrel protein [candidate division KSB1 bacterium]|nr:outer membrane beta-barrel protein [candidate division KSB1 bacterium]
MKKQLLLTIFMALLAGKALAQGGYTIKVGGTYSSFRGQGSEQDLGFALGIGREWKISKRTGLAFELMYTAKKAVFRNKTVAHEYYWYFGDAFDIYSDIRYIEIPFTWKYYLPIKKSLLIKLYVGPSLELAIRDRSKMRHLYNIDTPQRDFKYDFVFSQYEDPWPWLGRSGFNVNGGIAIDWSAFTVELRYSRALHDVDVISYIAMNEKLDFLQLLIGLRIE